MDHHWVLLSDRESYGSMEGIVFSFSVPPPATTGLPTSPEPQPETHVRRARRWSSVLRFGDRRVGLRP